MKLLTLQKPGIDITSNVDPTPDYTDWRGAYYDLAKYLGWNKWIWCLSDLPSFEENDYMRWNNKVVLWVLDVPEDYITWASLEGQCEGKEPSTFIFPNWREIEDLNETPMGLIPSPIKKDWVLFKWYVDPHKPNEGGKE